MDKVPNNSSLPPFSYIVIIFGSFWNLGTRRGFTHAYDKLDKFLKCELHLAVIKSLLAEAPETGAVPGKSMEGYLRISTFRAQI